jgi:hypothetical protein
MKIGFDLDGTLDRPGMAELAKVLLAGGHEVFVISGCFDEAGAWQDEGAKWAKLVRLGLAVETDLFPPYMAEPGLHLTVLHAVSHEKFDRDYRLADIGLRKGAFIAEQGIQVMFDDSEMYCKLMPAYCGATIAHVR